MANENQQNDVAPHAEVVQQSLASMDAEALGKRGASRRRFARAGAGATGVLMTLASQPGMACSVCRAPSGLQSVKVASQTAARPPNCQGVPPKTWYANCSSPWKDVPFKNVFSCNRTTAAIGNCTAQQILSLCNANATSRNLPVAYNNDSTLAMWLVAAYLNVFYKKSEFLTTDHLTAIWREYQLNGTFRPTGGTVAWSYSQIVGYLSGTMD